jgi:non-specific serine/threonine protein kinase
VAPGDYGLATTLGEKGLALCRELADEEASGPLLLHLAIAAMQQGDYNRATFLYEECADLSRETNNWIYGQTLCHLGMLARYQGNYRQATALLTQSLAVLRKVGDKWSIAATLVSLGFVALNQGDYERATVPFTESLILCRELRNRWVSQECVEAMAQVASAQRHYDRAARLFGAADAANESLGHRHGSAFQAYRDQHVALTRSALGDAVFTAEWGKGRQ